MASLSQRQGSPYWQVRFRDPLTGKRKREPTPYRINDRMETRAARELCARKTYEEKKSFTRSTQRDRWPAWVRQYIEQRYHDSPKTRARYLTSWKTVEGFLLERGIESPARVTHQTPRDYIAWRRDSRKSKKSKPIAPATIAGEVKAWRIVMDEAVRRGFATVNHCLRLGLSRKPVREMRPLTLEEEAQIRDAVTNGIPERRATVTQTNQHGSVFSYEMVLPAWEPPGDWMRRSFEIALAQGCRFSETRLPLDDINLERMTIKIRGKGGKVFVTALNPLLVPLVRELKAANEKMTWDLPAAELRQCARNWTRLFKRLGIVDFWFHCTRATAITRAHEMGVSYPMAMKFFGHASGTVHAIYTLLGVEDVSPVAEALASYASTRCNRSSESADAPSANRARARAKSGRARHTQTGSRKLSSR